MLSLNQFLEYRNPAVIERYCFEHPDVSHQVAEQLFSDLIAWMWLSHIRHIQGLQSHMIAPLNQLDHMWHTFILHTRAYTDFCQQYFGEYIHHEVETVGDETVLNTEELSAYFSDCYDHLGPEWLVRNITI